MAKDRRKSNRIMRMKSTKSVSGFMDISTNANYMVSTSAVICEPKKDVVYLKSAAILSNLLEILSHIYKTKTNNGGIIEPSAKNQCQKLAIELRQSVNRGSMPLTIEYIVNRLVQDMNYMVTKDYPEERSICTKLSEWFNTRQQNLLKSCAAGLVVNAYEAHAMLVHVVQVLNKLMSLPQYQRFISIKHQLNPYYEGIETAYNVANASIKKCFLNNEYTSSGLIRRTDPDVVSSSTKATEIPYLELGPKICPVQPDVFSLWKLLGVPFKHNEFSATKEFLQDLNLGRFLTRLRTGLEKVKQDLTYVATNNTVISTHQIEISKKLTQFHVDEAKNMINDARLFIVSQRQKKDLVSFTLQGEQKELARLQEDYAKIEKEIERQQAIIKETGPVPLPNTKTRFAAFNKKMLDSEKEANKLRGLICKHEETITSMEAAFEAAIAKAIMQLSDAEKEKAEVIKFCEVEKKRNEEITKNSESAERSLIIQRRVKGVEVFTARYKRFNTTLHRKMLHVAAQLTTISALFFAETDPFRKDILFTSMVEWNNTKEELKRAEIDNENVFRMRSDDILSGILSIEEALKIKSVEVQLPKRMHQIELPEPVVNVNLPTPIVPPKGPVLIKKTRFPIEANDSYQDLPPIGVIPKNFIKKSNNTWCPPPPETDTFVNETNSNTSIASQFSMSSHSTFSNPSTIGSLPAPLDPSYNNSYYRSAIRPYLGPSMAKQFAKLQAKKRLPVPF